MDGNQAAAASYTGAVAKSGNRFDNDYCRICRFRGEKFVSVRAYLDSALVAKIVQAGE
jgi:uncharacterized protein